ncbi:MAG: hypothetical protein WD960_02925 [Gemmatimonadota bacterium]
MRSHRSGLGLRPAPVLPLHTHPRGSLNRLLLLSILILVLAPLAQTRQIPVGTTSDVARVQYVRGVHAAAHLEAMRMTAFTTLAPSFKVRYVGHLRAAE